MICRKRTQRYIASGEKADPELNPRIPSLFPYFYDHPPKRALGLRTERRYPVFFNA